MTNFFNAIGVADMERVHSAVIGWMLSDGCTAFSRQTKSDIINTMFKPQTSRVFSQISVFVEVYNIDILIVTKDASGNEECWVIENKIKSNQHHNQLDKYVKIIACEEIGEEKKAKIITDKYKYIPEAKRHFCFLTLIGEEPQSSFVQKWHNFTYKEFCDVLSCAIKTGTTKDKHWIILNEYVECIKELNKALEKFLANPSNYEHVFTDGNKKKADKNEEYLQKIEKKSGKLGRFISECGLETIFQKCYLGNEWSNHLKKTQKKKCDWGIYETWGNAALDNGYPTIKGKITGEKEKYNTQIEFQNGTFKVQITPSKDNNILKDDFFEKWKRLFEDKKKELNETMHGQKPEWDVNCSRKDNKSRYISLSLQVEDWWKSSNLWTNIGTCEKLLDELIKKGNCVKAP